MVEIEVPSAENLTLKEDTLSVDLSDGRTISVRPAWFPRRMHGSEEERVRRRLIGGGHGIHWEDLDEDIRVEGLLGGKASGESQASLSQWLGRRKVDATGA
jgi:hypothetical protein